MGGKQVHNLTARDKFDMSDMNPFTRVIGDVTDISNMYIHKFYDMVRYWEQKAGFPFLKSKFGQVLGPCCNNGNQITIYIITENGSSVPCRTIIPLTMAKMNTPDATSQRVIFDNLIRKKHRDLMNLPPWKIEANEKKKVFHSLLFIPYKDDEVGHHSIPENDVIDMNISRVDAFVNAKVLLLQGEESEGYEGSSLV